MTDFRCTCDRRELFWRGCTCRRHEKRTLAINLSIPIIGWRNAWNIISRESWKLPTSCEKIQEPDDDQGVLHAMWIIERNNPDLYDDIARKFEAEVDSGTRSNRV